MLRTITRAAGVLALLVAGYAHGGPVNINTADAATLAAELEGIGQARAEAIVKYRETVGRFESPEQLLDVSGVGPRILEWNAERIIVGPEKTPD
jgi:competence protein ComEA